MRYQAVLFDLDDTLIPEAPAIERGFAAVAERVWGSSSAERIELLWDAAEQVLCEQAPVPDYLAAVHITASDLLHGELTAAGPAPDALRQFVPHYEEHAFDPVLPASARPNTRELVELWRETRLSALTVYPETVALLDALSSEVPLALVTNGLSTLQRAKVRVTGLSEYFVSVVVAEDVGAAKPDPAMFRETLRRLEVNPGEAVMVGNDPERDIAGGRAAGLDTIQVAREPSCGDGGRTVALGELLRRLGAVPPGTA